MAAPADALTIPEIVEKALPSAVGISSTFEYTSSGGGSYWGFNFYDNYGGQGSTSTFQATGSGIVMSSDGYIITNAHVIYDNESQYKMGVAKKVQVVLNGDYYDGETQLEATIVGYDTAEDIAVLKVNTDQKLTVAEFGDSDDLRVGELVVAIGNPLGFDLFGSVTTGIVSALNREVTINDSNMQLIQHDASINSGNSGGPLINSYGQVIGINSSKMSSNYYNGASIEGLSFAIPMSHAKGVINDLINKGYVTGKPLIGISTINVTEEQSQVYGIPVGVCIAEITPGGAADLVGLKKSDIIIAVNGETVTTGTELNAIKDKFKAGDTITITAVRSGQDMTFELTLQEKVPGSN
jgi:serine protease Do